MKLKSLVFLLIFGAIGYWLYGFVTTQFSQDVMAYKRYASALLDGEQAKVSNLVSENGLATKPFMAGKERKAFLNGTRRFVSYELLHKSVSEDGKHVSLQVRQKVRIDPPGADSFFGTEVRKDIHKVTLVLDQSAWKIDSFQDTPTMNMLLEKSKK